MLFKIKSNKKNCKIKSNAGTHDDVYMHYTTIHDELIK